MGDGADNDTEHQTVSAPTPVSVNPAPFQFSLRTAIIVMLLASVLLGIGMAGYRALRRAVDLGAQAEYTLHATAVVTLAIGQFVKDHPGRWPKSWDELRGTSVPRRGMFSWPKDAEEIQKRVKVDFDAHLDDLARQDLSTFRAVSPIGPHYSVDGYLQGLLMAIRADVERRAKQPSEVGR